MSSAEAAAARAGFNPWTVALTVTLATFMEVLDTSIANVALPHIAGSLAASAEESTWVLTSYLVANAVVLPLSGWLSEVIGRKRFNMLCVLLFTLSSALCGAATSLGQLVFFRVLQGLGGGGLQPSVQAILVDTFPPQKRGMAMSVYTMAILIAPILGPTLGGWIADNTTWRWIFFINVPVGAVSLFLTNIVLQDPPYLTARRAARSGRPLRIDYVGLGLLSLGLGALEMALDKGQTEDWFASRLIVVLSAVAGAALLAAVVWELRHPEPIVNLRLFAGRNFAAACVVVFGVFGVLYGSTVLLPQMLELLMNYSATQAGLVLSPAGVVTMLELPLVGILLARGTDPRRLIAVGLAGVAASCFWMGHLNLQVAPGQVVWPRVAQVMGAGLFFVPINMLAFAGLPREQSNNASALFNLVRNMGGSIGVAAVTALLQRWEQFHQVRLAGHVNPLNPVAVERLGQMATATGLADPVARPLAALRAAYGVVQQQAALLSYLDAYRLFALVALAAIPLVFLMRRPAGRAAGDTAAH